MKHTPGPWEVVIPKMVDRRKEPYHIRGGKSNLSYDGLSMIAVVCLQATLTEGNAHLIAASPDMLEALEEVLYTSWNAQASMMVIIDAINKARAAIAKAKGE